MSLFSGPVFGSLADKIGAYSTLILVFLILSLAQIILIIEVPVTLLYISVTLFGLSAWVIPSLVTVLTAGEFGHEQTAYVFSIITLVFAIGQIIGPITTGFLVEHNGSYEIIFMLLVILTITHQNGTGGNTLVK